MGCCATAQMPEEVLPGDPLRASSIFYLQRLGDILEAQHVSDTEGSW